MSCLVMSCHVMSCRVMSCLVMLCHVVSCRVMLCRVMSRHVVSVHVVSCRVVSCLVVDKSRSQKSCPVGFVLSRCVWGHVLSRHVMSCHVMFCPVLSCKGHMLVEQPAAPGHMPECVAHATRPTQPAAAFNKMSAPSLRPQIHGFPAPATISQHVTRERAPAHANSRTGPRNPAILASAHDSLRLPRKTMPSEVIDRTIHHACHAKRTLRARFPTPASRIHVRDTSGGHLAPHLLCETHAQQRPYARFPTPATRIHRPLPPRARQCIRSPTPATRNARAPTSKWTFPHTCHADPPASAFPSSSMHPESHACHAKRTSTFPARHTPWRQSAWHGINDAPATTPRRHRADTQQTKRTRVQPPHPQTINGNPSLRIREKGVGQPCFFSGLPSLSNRILSWGCRSFGLTPKSFISWEDLLNHFHLTPPILCNRHALTLH